MLDMLWFSFINDLGCPGIAMTMKQDTSIMPLIIHAVFCYVNNGCCPLMNSSICFPESAAHLPLIIVCGIPNLKALSKSP